MAALIDGILTAFTALMPAARLDIPKSDWIQVSRIAKQ